MHVFSREPDADHPERVISFPSRGRDLDRNPDRPPRRAPSRPRRARRRRDTTPWLQRNALGIAAVSILVAVLGLGFGLAQFIARPEPNPALLAVPTDQAAVAPMPATSDGQAPTAAPTPVAAPDGGRPIQASANVLQPNYTVQSGDTLGRIAAQFNTSVDRIEAFNNLPDPRALRVGTKLVIPPAF